MSSHHFVKEGQEPAVLVTAEDISKFTYFDQVAGWNPIVICMESALNTLMLNSIHVDHVIINDRETNSEVYSALWPHLKLHYLDIGDVESVLTEILSCGSTGHLMIVSDDFNHQMEYGQFGLTVLTPTEKWVRVDGGVFKSWYAKDSHILLRGTGMMINGNEVREEYHVVNDGLLEIEAASLFWVGMKL
jgi:hypothetical protein